MPTKGFIIIGLRVGFGPEPRIATGSRGEKFKLNDKRLRAAVMTTTSSRGGGYAISESDYEYSDESEYS